MYYAGFMFMSLHGDVVCNEVTIILKNTKKDRIQLG